MTLTEGIINLLREDKLSDAMDLTETILYSKLSDAISEKYEEVAPSLFGEAKKAKVTDKDDDGEGMDPVGHGDDDIDNDGDSDDSDEYLKNRRKVIGKAIKKEETELDENMTNGMPTASYKTKSPEQQSLIRQNHYTELARKEKQKESDRIRDTRAADAERKKKERDQEKKDIESGKEVEER